MSEWVCGWLLGLMGEAGVSVSLVARLRYMSV